MADREGRGKYHDEVSLDQSTNNLKTAGEEQLSRRLVTVRAVAYRCHHC